MASLLGSMATALGKGIEQTGKIKAAEQARKDEQKWRADMEERRAKREEALAQMRMQHDSTLAQENREFTAGQNRENREFQSERDRQANEAAIRQAEIAAKNKASEREYGARREDVSYLRDTVKELNNRVPEARIRTATDALIGADNNPAAMFSAEDLEVLDQKLRIYTSFPEDKIIEAGLGSDREATLKFFELLEEQRALQNAPVRTSLDNPMQEWANDNDATAFINRVVTNNSGGSPLTVGERQGFLERIGN